jgi:hypothetical protein
MDWRLAPVGFVLFFAADIFAQDDSGTLPPVPPSTSPPMNGPTTGIDLDSQSATQDPTPATQQPKLVPADNVGTEPVWVNQLRPQKFLPWLSVEYATSPEITEQRTGYTSFEAFVPFAQWESGLGFLDGDGFVNNYGRWGSNIGLGSRIYNNSTNRILGFNTYWDNNDTPFGDFNQVGLGIESLGRYLDFRANGYIPVGRTETVVGVTYSNPSFVGHSLMFDQHTITASAMNGFDTEVGGWVPYLGRYGLRAYGGAYGFQGPDAPATVGGHFRLEERATDNVDLNLTVDSDRVFHTTVMFSIGFRFGGGARRKGANDGSNVFSRLVDRVQRNDNIIVLDPDIVTEITATKPGSNDPIIIDHYASYAAAGGNGTIEHPFNTLTNPAGPHPADILYVWANSVFNGQNIVLMNNQRLLGEGLNYTYTTSQGTFVLGRVTSLPNMPIIQNAPGNAVTLANNNEVAGLMISGAAQDGIYGNGVTGFYIHDNTITRSGLNGIVLVNLNATGSIVDNIVNYNGDHVAATGSAPMFGEGIYLQGTSFTGDITGNTANYNGDLTGGVHSVYSNSGTAAFGQGIAVNVATYNGNITDNTANANGTIGAPCAHGTGVETEHSATTTFGQGIAVNAKTFNGNIEGNTTDGNGTFGNLSDHERGVVGHGTITFGEGIAVSAANFNGNIDGNTANGNGSFGNISDHSSGVKNDGTVIFGQGILESAAVFNGNIDGNTTNRNGTFGSITDHSSGVRTDGTVIFSQGIAVINANSFTGNINGNTSNGNGGFGLVGEHSTGVRTDDTTIFSQGIFVQARSFDGSLDNNTLLNNGTFVVPASGGTNVSVHDTPVYGQGMLLEGFGNGSFMASVDGNAFGNNHGTQGSNNNGSIGTDLLATYTGTGHMVVELGGNTTANVFSQTPPFNYDLQIYGSGIFHLQNNQAATGGNGSVGTSSGSAPTP